MKSVLVLAALGAISACGARAAPQVVQSEAGEIRIERLASLDNPWGMSYLPDGRLLISEKPGRLRILANGKLSEPVQGVPKVAHGGQGGLLGVQVHPDFAQNSFVYLSFSEPGANGLIGGAVARGKLADSQLSNVSVIWRQAPKTTGEGHFGGRLAFARDGKLFISSGERQKLEPAQDMSGTLGKIVRINPDGSVPADNPFVNRTGIRPEIWSSGHRNPLGIAIHPASSELWENEMGAKGGDEINRIQKGGNYGWPVVSEGSHYDGRRIPRHSTRPEFIAPVHFWASSISPSSLAFYTGDRFAQWRGNLLLGGLSSKALLRLSLDGNKVTNEERIAMGERIRDVIQAPDGAVLLLTDGDNGALLRLTPAAAR